MKLEPGTKVTDKLTLVHLLGEGAMGEVWVAEHTTLETEVAVKFVAEELTKNRPDAVARFNREATAAAQIRSPHVVQMFDHGVMEGDRPYIVMELLHGESLHDRLEREGTIPLSDTIIIVNHVARALSAAHDRGVIHRDIKPHNVFLLEAHGEPFVKVLDFGIAKRTAMGDELTEPGTIIGTPQYVSRDLIMAGDQRTVNEQVDLWSLAIVAYKCLTGRLPFDGDTIGKICAALAAGTFVRPSEIRPELGEAVDQWFERALAPEPEDRFGNAVELARSFRQLGAPSSEFPAPHTTSHPRTGRSLVVPLVGGGLLIGAAIGGAIHFSGSSAAPAPTVAALAPPTMTVTTTATTSATASASATAAATATASASATGPVLPIEVPDDMVLVPAGRVWLGCHRDRNLECDADEIPGHPVKLSAFLIDRTEVRVIDYAQCVISGECSDRRLEGYAIDGGAYVESPRCNWKQRNRERHPINCVSWSQAAAYCEWRGGRLPTEAEWERAARGDDKRRFPWGDEPASCLNTVMAEEGDQGCGKGGTWPVANKPKDVSPFGAMDMAGNVREWVHDWYDARYYKLEISEDPQGPEHGSRRVARGGGWGNVVARFMRVSRRENHEPTTRSMHLGFRCARDASPAHAGTSAPADAGPADASSGGTGLRDAGAPAP